MTILDDKEWYKSKTFWAGAVLMFYAAYLIFTGQGDKIDEILISLFGGTGLIGLRQAIGKV